MVLRKKLLHFVYVTTARISVEVNQYKKFEPRDKVEIWLKQTRPKFSATKNKRFWILL